MYQVDYGEHWFKVGPPTSTSPVGTAADRKPGGDLDVGGPHGLERGGAALACPEISLVVSTVGRPDCLGRLTDSLIEELAAGLRVELIVVDQSPDGCCRSVLVDRDESAPPLSWIYLRTPLGVSRGRNAGLTLARGELTMFPDDDAWFDGDTLARALAHLRHHPEHDGLCSQLQDGNGGLSMLRWANSARPVTKNNHHRTSIGSTMLFRTDVARAVGGFDESIGPGAGGWYGSCEDADFLLRIVESGSSIWYDPSVVMNHRDSRQDGGPAASHKALVYGCGQGHMWRRHRFPPWLIIGLALRRTIGGTLWSLRGRPDIGQAHRAWVRGSLNGWLGRPPVDLTEPEAASSIGSSPPTEAEFSRSFSWRLLAAPLGTIATFALTTIVARTMSPAEVTVFYAILAALMIGPILGRFGLNQWAVRDLAALRTRAEPEAAVALARRFAVSAAVPAVIAAPLVSFVVVAGSRSSDGLDLRLALLATVILMAETWRLTVSDTLIGLGSTGWAALLAHQFRAIVVFGVVAVFLGLAPRSLDLYWLLEMMAAVVVSLAAVAAFRLWSLPSRSRSETSPIKLGRLIRRGFPFLVVDLVVVVVARGDVWLAGPAFASTPAALYGTASVLAAQIGVPMGLASIALAPVVAGHVAQRRLDAVERSVRSLSTAVAYVVVPIAAVLVIFGRQLLELAFGARYVEAYPYLVCLMAGNVALAVFGAGPVVLLMAGRHREAAVIVVSWFSLAAPLAIAAAVLVGPMGLAVASALTTVGLYLLTALTVWVVTGVPLLPYLNPSRLDIASWARTLRTGSTSMEPTSTGAGPR